MILEWKKLYIQLIALYAHPENSNHLRSHLRAVMDLDCLQIWVRVIQPFILFIHHIRGETVLWSAVFIIQNSDKMQYFTIFQDKLQKYSEPPRHAWAFSETVQKISIITYTASRFSLLTSAKFAVSIKRVTLQHNNEFMAFTL